jgi:hypothetical protein
MSVNASVTFPALVNERHCSMTAAVGDIPDAEMACSSVFMPVPMV